MASIHLLKDYPELDLRMHPQGIHRIVHYHPGTAIQCNQGALWVTQAGDPYDHVLYEGDQFTSDGHGKVLIEAMREARVSIVSPN